MWAEKRRLAREGQAYGGQVPRWLKLADGQYSFRDGAKVALRLIYRLATQGLGNLSIVRKLVADGVPHFQSGRPWRRGYVAKILASRATMGEYQPYKGSRQRVPEGDPIPNYFPAAVTEAEWFAAQRAKQARTRASGRPSKSGQPTSPFAGLFWNAADGAKLRVRRWRGQPKLWSGGIYEGTTQGKQVSFPLDHLVDGVLSQLREIAAADLFHDDGAALVDDLQGQMDATESRLKVALERFRADPQSPSGLPR